MGDKRSKLVIISSIWTIVYALLVTNQNNLTTPAIFLTVLFIFPAFFVFQVFMYAKFKGFGNAIVYQALFLSKCIIYLAQPTLASYNLGIYAIGLSAILVFIIDYIVMSKKNEIDMSQVEVSEKEKEDLKKGYKGAFKDALPTLFPVFLLFNVYSMGVKNIEGTTVMFYAFCYWFICLKRKENVKLQVLTTLGGFILLFGVGYIPLPESIDAILSFAILVVTYMALKKVMNLNK